MLTRLAIATLMCSLSAMAEGTNTQAPQIPPAPETLAKPKAVTPALVRVDANTYRIGDVSLIPTKREIRFPGKVNMTDGLIEYLIVLKQGKVHEALFISEISPTHLNLALKLLRYVPSPELFSLMDEGHMTGVYPEVSPSIKSQARILMEVEWDDNGTTKRTAINEWIQNSNKATAMAPGPWLYTGADLQAGKFIPDLTGDIAAIMTVPTAMINYPGSDNGGETVWFPFPKRVPQLGTPVTLIITPHSISIPKP